MHSQNSSSNEFFLVVTEPTGLEERYSLHRDQVTDIGRAGTNRIVLRDEVCSRNHCEIFKLSTGWMLRDRNSRNGTYLNETPVEADRPLIEGDIIRIGETMLLFTSDEFASLDRRDSSSDGDTAMDLRISDETIPLPEIIHRQKQSSFRDSEQLLSSQENKSSAKLSRLYQLALQMGEATNTEVLCEIVLDGLVGITGADIGAILMRTRSPRQRKKSPLTPGDFELRAYRTSADRVYQPVSKTVSQQVLSTNEAVLARDILGIGELADRDSLDELQARSLIVSPVLDDQEMLGLIHLYSTNPEIRLDRDGLDYTLAVADQFAIALKNLRKQQDLQDGYEKISNENLMLRAQLEIQSELIGDSQVMVDLRERIGLVARADTVALIRGESGVGKELVARAIHFNSKRHSGPFVCLNCAALSESLLESELFGHEKGAFTGATELKHGKFEQAHQGTLFLDEVGEMSPAIQAKFLRVLEGHAFERVGGASSVKVDVRLVAATNRDLEQAVREGQFRKDLYFRLQVLEILVPPLRDRMQDVALLAQFFANRFAKKSGRQEASFTPAALERLTSYDWPGNVRELQNTIERAVVLCPGHEIGVDQILLSSLDDSPLQIDTEMPTQGHNYIERSIEDLERAHIAQTLDATSGNKSKAAQILGIERSTLDRKLKKYGLRVERD